MSGPPAFAKKEPSAFVATLIASANRPHAVIDFPLVGFDGKPVAHVHIRGLSQAEEDIAFANARAYTSRLTRADEESRWRPEDIEHNARASEVLAVCCRKADDPSQPFFESGVVDTREFETEVLGQLFNAYAELKEKFYPRVTSLSVEEFEAWIAVIAEGAESIPFHSYSRTQLEALCRSAVMSLVDARATITTLTDSSTSDS